MPRSATGTREFALILALARGDSVANAANAAGVSRSTVLRRLQKPDFRQQVQDARAAMVDEAMGRLSQAASAAVVTLMDLLRARSEMARLGAARTILEMLAKYREEQEVYERLVAVEELVKERDEWQKQSGSDWQGSRIG